MIPVKKTDSALKVINKPELSSKTKRPKPILRCRPVDVDDRPDRDF